MSALLSTTIFWLAATLVVFVTADLVSRRSNRNPLCHPTLLSFPVLMAALVATRTSYATYAASTELLVFLLGPAVVGMAVPIWARRTLIRHLAVPIGLALAAGAIVATTSAVGVLGLFGAPLPVLASIAPRATTTPVAIEIAAQLGGVPAIAVIVVLLSGILGALSAAPLFNRLGIRDYRARGFAVGISAHGFGTARAYQVDATAGAFASLGMALNAIFTAALLSLWPLLG